MAVVAQRMEVWLRTNSRPYWAALLFPALLAAAGVACLLWAPSFSILGWVLVAIALVLAGLLIWKSRQPILARRDDQLILFLGAAPPIAIPLQIVECFFSGQGDAMVTDRTGKPLEASAIILRLAEAATEWKHRDVESRFAHWCEGYITLRGAWCEPINTELLRSLNQRLVAAQRALKASTT